METRPIVLKLAVLVYMYKFDSPLDRIGEQGRLQFGEQA